MTFLEPVIELAVNGIRILNGHLRYEVQRERSQFPFLGIVDYYSKE